MGKHDHTVMDRARDELMSHVIRCEVLEAEHQHRREWLDETIDYMADRYPQLSDLQVTQLEMIGRQFIKPPIPHGAGHTAATRDRRLEEKVEAEVEHRADVKAEVDDEAVEEELQAVAA